ncbi:MAG: cell division protein CrgA [Jiangellales bacterium]
MPESRRRKKAPSAKPAKQDEFHDDQPSGRWVPITGSALLIFGLLWIVTFYVAGGDIPGMNALGNWNLIVGMGFIVAGFLVFTRWK